MAPQRHPLEKTRNIGIMAHIDAGKTTTTERILYYTGRNYKIGEVHEGAATMDWMVQEQERGITITSAATTCVLARTTASTSSTRPATSTSPSRSSGRCASSTARSRCSTVWPGSSPRPRPSGARPTSTASPASASSTRWTASAPTSSPRSASIEDRLEATTAVVQLPIGAEGHYRGVVDLVEMNAIVWDRGDDLGASFDVVDIPEELRRPRPRSGAHKLIDVLSLVDESIADKFLMEEEITADDLRVALRKGTVTSEIVPVLNGSAFKNKGVQPLLDAVVDYLPSPVDLPPVQGMNVKGTETVERKPSDLEQLRRPGLQDHDRAPRRQAHLLPGLLRPGRQGRPGHSTPAPATRSGWVACWRCTPTTRRTSTSPAPVTSWPPSGSRTCAPATRCATPAIRSCSRSSCSPSRSSTWRSSRRPRPTRTRCPRRWPRCPRRTRPSRSAPTTRPARP